MAKQSIKKKLVREMILNTMRNKLNEVYYGQEQTPEYVKQQFDNLRSNSFDMSDMGEDYGEIYFIYDPSTNKMIAGDVANAGLRPQFELEYDPDISLDENLQALYEHIAEELASRQFENTVRNKLVDVVCEALGIPSKKKKVNEDINFGDLSDLLLNIGWDIIGSDDGKYKGQPAMRVMVAPNRKAAPTEQMIKSVQEYIGNEGTVISSVGQSIQAPELKRQSIIIVWN